MNFPPKPGTTWTDHDGRVYTIGHAETVWIKSDTKFAIELPTIASQSPRSRAKPSKLPSPNYCEVQIVPNGGVIACKVEDRKKPSILMVFLSGTSETHAFDLTHGKIVTIPSGTVVEWWPNAVIVLDPEATKAPEGETKPKDER